MSDFDDVTFAPVPITDVFQSMAASRAWYDKVHLVEGEGANLYLSQTLLGNSVAGVVADQGVSPEAGNCVTVTLKTQATFYQPVPFYTAQNFLIFRHESLDEASGLFLVTVMRRALAKFSWGYGVSMARLRRTRIMVPVQGCAQEASTTVDWRIMRTLGVALMAQARDLAATARPSPGGQIAKPPALTFRPVLITDIFESMRASGAWYDKNKLADGPKEHVYTSRSGFSNGFEMTVAPQDLPPNPGNAVTIGVDTQTVFYQPMAFYTSVKVQVLRHQRLTPPSGLVLVALLRQQMSKFKWGNGASLDRLRATRIMVPVIERRGTRETLVDWDGMERYGRWLQGRVDGRVRAVLGESRPDA